MKYVRPAIFGAALVLLPRLIETLGAGKVIAYGVGTFLAFTAYLIPPKDESSLSLWNWVLLTVPFSCLNALLFGKLWR